MCPGYMNHMGPQLQTGVSDLPPNNQIPGSLGPRVSRISRVCRGGVLRLWLQHAVHLLYPPGWCAHLSLVLGPHYWEGLSEQKDIQAEVLCESASRPRGGDCATWDTGSSSKGGFFQQAPDSRGTFPGIPCLQVHALAHLPTWASLPAVGSG